MEIDLSYFCSCSLSCKFTIFLLTLERLFKSNYKGFFLFNLLSAFNFDATIS